MSSNKTIFFDLDDTLINTSERHYRVYCNIIKVLNLEEPIDKNEFWKLKREGISTVNILNGIDNGILEKFSKLWIDKIEEKNYLFYDTLLQRTLSLLSNLKDERLILLTMRNNRGNLIWEIKKLDLYDYFKSILSCSPLQFRDKTVPIINYINNNHSVTTENSVIVGDSEIDIITGKKLNMTTISVSYGIRSKDILLPFKPDYCLNDITEIIDTIKGI
jgi:phosphoglycolate phosphatase-like HAD superfamily hydrolase